MRPEDVLFEEWQERTAIIAADGVPLLTAEKLASHQIFRTTDVPRWIRAMEKASGLPE